MTFLSDQIRSSVPNTTVCIYIRGADDLFYTWGIRRTPSGLSRGIAGFHAGEGRTIKPRNLPERIHPGFSIKHTSSGAVVWAEFEAAGPRRCEELLKSGLFEDRYLLRLLSLLRSGRNHQGRLAVSPVRLVPYERALDVIVPDHIETRDYASLRGSSVEDIAGPLYDYFVARDITRLLQPYAKDGVVQQLRRVPL